MSIESCVEGTDNKIFRYVDEFLVVLGHKGANSVEKVESVFQECDEGLNFVK